MDIYKPGLVMGQAIGPADFSANGRINKFRRETSWVTQWSDLPGVVCYSIDHIWIHLDLLY